MRLAVAVRNLRVSPSRIPQSLPRETRLEIHVGGYERALRRRAKGVRMYLNASRIMMLPAVALALLGASACGGSSTSTSPSGAAKRAASRPTREYRVVLSGAAATPRGAPQGAGAAVVAVHGNTHLCWRFAHLHGFREATSAHIYRGAAGSSGPIVVPLSTEPKLRHQGCVRASAPTIHAIERDPAGFYVTIHSRQYPGGAVRGQLQGPASASR